MIWRPSKEWTIFVHLAAAVLIFVHQNPKIRRVTPDPPAIERRDHGQKV
jgi:hypothetical protein